VKEFKAILLFLLLAVAGATHAQTEDWLWAKQIGGTSSGDSGRAIATDANGNIYVTGYFEGTATFGSISLTGSGDYEDIFVAKIDANGNWLWAKKAGGSSEDYGYGIATDAVGNCYVTGCFNGAATFGSSTLTSSGNEDIFVAKLDSYGNWLWAKKAGGTGDDSGLSISIDNSGNSRISGTFTGTATFGSISLTSSGYTDILIAKLDVNGNWLWAKKAGGSSSDDCKDIAVDANGNSYVTGRFYGTATFGSTSLTSNGGSDVFVSKLSSSGSWLWTKQGGGNGDDYGSSITIDVNRNSYLTGIFKDTANFGSTSLISSGSSDVLVTKLDPNGNWLWANQAGGISLDYGTGIAVDTNGTSHITGYFAETAFFGSIALTSLNGLWDPFVAKMDQSGNWLWAKKGGGTGLDYGRDIASDNNGSSFVTGSFSGAASFGSTSIVSSGAHDAYVARFGLPITQVLAPNGGEYWQAGTLHTVYWNFLFTGSAVNIFISTNKGQEWIPVNSSPVEAALGRYTFTVPNVSSNQCLIKVESTSNSSHVDVSDASFSIGADTPAALVLTAPSNSKLQAEMSYDINWLATGVSNVDLHYSTDGGLTWQSIVSNLPANQGVYNWLVPDVSAAVCFIKITSSDNTSIYDLSDNHFCICRLVLLNPNGGDLFQTGSIRDITWHADLITSVKLQYSTDAGNTWQAIIDNTPASACVYSWTVPEVVSGQYLIKVSDSFDGSIMDVSDNTFTGCSLAITNPNNAGIKLQNGWDFAITWNTQLLSGTVTLELTTNGTAYTPIATGIDAALQSYLWRVPDSPSTNCKIRIVSDLDSQVSSTSGHSFTICRLRLISPNGMETWGAQSVKTISWLTAYIGSLNMEYSADNGQSWQLIAVNIAASAGSYNWTLPNIESSECLLRISDFSDGQYFDSCDSVFTIRPQIKLVAPNGNEIISFASVFNIIWTTTAEVQYVRIDYSIDSGANWLSVIDSYLPASVGSYGWYVPNNPSANCLVRIRKHDNGSIFDVSDEVFSITASPQSPTAQFSADLTAGLEPLSVQFSDNSTSGTGNITSWLWQFGNGDSSTQQHPLYVYNSPGFYSVTLTVTNGAGLSSSLTLEDYITVLPRYPEIITNPEDRLDFGNVYLGSSSDAVPLWISNTGTATLVVDAISYIQAPSPFSVQERSLPFSIPEGDSLCVNLVFTPQAAGTVTDSLYIHSNAQNRPVYALGLRGSGEYVPPKPPTGVETAMLGYDMHISWDPVTETIFDTPITPDGYLVFYNGSDDPDGEFYFHGFTPGLSYTHYYVGRYAQHMFYRVMAVKHYGTRAFDPDSLVRGMSEKEVLELLIAR